MTDTASAPPAPDSVEGPVPQDFDATQQQLQAELLAMPPVAALGLHIDAATTIRVCLQAPLASNVNDKGCAFGGSLTSMMTLAGWSLICLHLQRAGVQADVYVADSQVQYRAPLYSDLRAEAWLQDEAQAAAFIADVVASGRGELRLQAKVRCADGTVASSCVSRYVAKRRD